MRVQFSGSVATVSLLLVAIFLGAALGACARHGVLHDFASAEA